MRRVLTRGSVVAAIVGVLSGTGLPAAADNHSGSHLDRGRARASSPVLAVGFRFTYVSTPRPPNLAEARIAGLGTLLFDKDVEGESHLAAVGSGVRSARVVVELDLLTPHPRTETLSLEVSKSKFDVYETKTGEVQKQGLTLLLRVTKSTIEKTQNEPGCPVGTIGAARVVHTTNANYLGLDVCGFTIRSPNPLAAGPRSRLQVSITPKCLHQTAGPGGLCGPPTAVTLTVNDWTLTATKADPAAYLHHEQDEPLTSEKPLKIRASINHPLPKGWKLTVYHNGDVLSHGNGDWYKVCEIVGPSATTSCGDNRPGRIGPFDDIVWAAVSAPTYLAMHSDIYLHFNPR
jgi:hypothetical protein